MEKIWEHCYCIFCRCGAERKTGAEFERTFGDVLVIVPVKEKHKSINGAKQIESQIMLPGYLFLYSHRKLAFHEILMNRNIYRILKSIDGAAELTGSDRAFAQWLLINDGIVTLSDVHYESGKLVVSNGPLGLFQGGIIRVDKRSRNALVNVQLGDASIEVWLAFRWDDERGDVMNK